MQVAVTSLPNAMVCTVPLIWPAVNVVRWANWQPSKMSPCATNLQYKIKLAMEYTTSAAKLLKKVR